ncbi:hypothetical protein SmJEL517_g04551 [Synchytrium microbalum]|uniref:Multicopper oxidase n=1 Tax=Synchytrium microbalum TaxID=1806994 RepID=A0A507BZ17_9FUNG|nr:uncharacterized protein SmJEL517_g04551 [Synchytrium microbalum]TPX32371.1 hypothetical protein SmJEL517_g04551 [Synchytrium microbalum]
MNGFDKLQYEEHRLKEWHSLPHSANRRPPTSYSPEHTIPPPTHSYELSTLDKPNTKRNRFILILAISAIVVLGVVAVISVGTVKKWWGNTSSQSNIQPDPAWVVSAIPNTRTYNFVVSSITGSQDGVVKQMLVVNGQYPGPLIEANMGDRIIVNVQNNLVNGTALHWHGLHQNGSNWMDGTVAVTQCPIPPGGNFTYDFTVPDQYGTFWWHAHASTQYNDGIVGPLIIHSPSDPLQNTYDKDVVILLTDWYHDFSQSLVATYLTTGLPNNPSAEPVPDNGLINGQNIFNCSSNLARTCNGGGSRAAFNFLPGLKYRLRLINVGAFADFMFSVDGHELSVVEADSTVVNPVVVHRVPIHVAQRYSVILTTNQPSSAYWIRASMTQSCFKYTPSWLNPNILAILRYSTVDSSTTPTSLDWNDDTSSQPSSCIDLSPSMLVPTIPKTPPVATSRYNLSISFTNAGNGATTNRGFINGMTWTPYMNTSSLALANVGGLVSTSTSYVETVGNVTVADLVLNNLDVGAHPFHMHGLPLYILAMGSGLFTGATPTNITNPLRRDTVVLPSNGYAIVRIIFDNPGIWTLHCHISWHMSAGLLMQWQVLPSVVRGWSIPSAVGALCKSAGVGGALTG